MVVKEQRKCKKHGMFIHYLNKGKKSSWKCQKCNTEYVTESRRRNKLKLIEAFGGKCSKCAYNRYAGSLEFHHTDPSQKDFGLSSGGNSWSYKRMFAEAQKCILVCSNCHKEIHAGIQ
jgi:hypothetical protein